MRVLLSALAAATTFAAVGAQAATEPRIGTTASAQREVTGTLGGDRRVLKLGDGVFQNEDIATGDAASAQILFSDETALTMGPNSRVTLDKLVYDPATRQGELALRATAGAFRFISGSGPKAGYKIETPVGTIGVRGTIIQFTVQPPWLRLELVEGGTVLCTKAGKCVELNQPGTYLVSNGTDNSTNSKYDKSCKDSAGNCKVSDGSDTLFIDFLGLNRFTFQFSPPAGPNGPPPPPPNPGNGPPPPPPPNPGEGPPPPPPTDTGNTPPPPPPTGHPPIETGAGTIPPGLQNKIDAGSLPPGLAKRGPDFLPPGQAKKN